MSFFEQRQFFFSRITKKVILAVIICIYCPLLLGCGTMRVFGPSQKFNTPYTDVQMDVILALSSVIHDYKPTGLLMLIDLPVALAIDTICLPIDTCNYYADKKALEK